MPLVSLFILLSLLVCLPMRLRSPYDGGGGGLGVLPSSGSSQGQLHIRQSFNIPSNKGVNESIHPFFQAFTPSSFLSFSVLPTEQVQFCPISSEKPSLMPVAEMQLPLSCLPWALG